MPERIECVDNCSPLVADHPHFLEIDAHRRQIFGDIANVLILGAAGQDLAADHQERGRNGFFGSRRVGCWHGSPASERRTRVVQMGPPPVATSSTGRGDGRKILKPRNASAAAPENFKNDKFCATKFLPIREVRNLLIKSMTCVVCSAARKRGIFT
jgi:hypothetical protein